MPGQAKKGVKGELVGAESGSSKFCLARGTDADHDIRLGFFVSFGVGSVSAHHLPKSASPCLSRGGAREFSLDTSATAFLYGFAPKSERVPCITWGGVNASVFGANTAIMWWFGELSSFSFTAGKSEL